MGLRYSPSQCILGFIVFSTLLTVLGCTVCAVLLYLAPMEPTVWVYNGGLYTIIPTSVLIAGGLLTAVFSIVGCCAVCQDSKFMLIFFSLGTCLAAALYLASSATMFAFLYTGEIKGELSSTIMQQMLTYTQSVGEDYHHYMGTLQEENECCGVANYSDWMRLNTTWYQYREDPLALTPPSCCKADQQINNCSASTANIYGTGCLDTVLQRVNIVVDTVLGLTILMAIFQGLASLTGCYGARIIHKYEQYDVL